MHLARNLAVLVGNGLSVAFNEKLLLQSITAEVLDRIKRENGSDVVKAMKDLASHALPDGASSNDDFEVLVGAFGFESRTLGFLDSLAKHTEPNETALREAIATVASFAERVRDTGISHVLEVIAERSYADHQSARHLHSLVREIAQAFDGKIVYSNLNYDTLLLAALLTENKYDLADMGDGYQRTYVRVDDDSNHRAWKLRRSASAFPTNKRIQLLHLHGSLTFWHHQHPDDEGRNEYLKLQKDILEYGNQWEAMRKQDTPLRPTIVLASRQDKTDHVKQFPFSLAYEVFENGLHQADHWLVIGYSFRDDPVNERLRKEFAERDPKPRVLVVTLGKDPDQQTVERTFGWNKEDAPSDSWLTITRSGANGAERTEDWGVFAAK